MKKDSDLIGAILEHYQAAQEGKGVLYLHCVKCWWSATDFN